MKFYPKKIFYLYVTGQQWRKIEIKLKLYKYIKKAQKMNN